MNLLSRRRPARWSIFGLLLVLFAIVIVSSLAVVIVTDGSKSHEGTSGPINRTYLVLAALYGMIVNSFCAAVFASLYVELRNWKEGPATESLKQVFR